MILTLALPGGLIPQQPDAGAVGALGSSGFRRLQLSAQDPGRAYREADLASWIDTGNEAQLEIVLSVSTLLDKRIIDTTNCVVEGLKSGVTRVVPHRICPFHGNTERISDVLGRVVAQAISAGTEPTIHLSYFRFENVHQCLAPACLAKFSERVGHFIQRPDLDDSVYLEWLAWRQESMASTLRTLQQNAGIGSFGRAKTSIEVDFDHLKRYLVGPEIEEGLSVDHVVPEVDEAYLHVEASDIVAKSPHGNLRLSYEESYVHLLRYANSRVRKYGASPHLFFWNLASPRTLKGNLERHLELARLSAPSGVVLYSPLWSELCRETRRRSS